MKKKFLLALVTSLFVFNCHVKNTDTPPSPFDDNYSRIGMESEYEVRNQLQEGELEAIKNSVAVDKAADPDNVSHFEHKTEYRDLKYAYFGQESSTISQCSMLSQDENSVRYPNDITIVINKADQQTQTANVGIIKINSTVTDYTFDTKYKDITSSEKKYRQSRKTEKNDEAVKEELITEEDVSYVDPNSVFGLKPLASIKSHFPVDEFVLLGNNAACGTTADGKYLIKEGFSVFNDFTTTMGRSYKAEDNYFYEGLLEKDTTSSNGEAFRFTYFRFYHELLILSKAFDGTGVPVLYLDKPVVIEFREEKYAIEYGTNEPYTKDVPYWNKTPSLE